MPLVPPGELFRRTGEVLRLTLLPPTVLLASAVTVGDPYFDHDLRAGRRAPLTRDQWSLRHTGSGRSRFGPATGACVG